MGCFVCARLLTVASHHQQPLRFGVFYLAVPVGGALGFGVGAVVGSATSWRVAFVVCGLPGILAAWSCARLYDPPRGGLDPPLLSHSNEGIDPLSQSESVSHSLSQSHERVFDLQMPTAVEQTTGDAFAAAEGADDAIKLPQAGMRQRVERFPCADPGIEMQSFQKPATRPLPMTDSSPNASSSSLHTSAEAETDVAWKDDAWLIVSNPTTCVLH